MLTQYDRPKQYFFRRSIRNVKRVFTVAFVLAAMCCSPVHSASTKPASAHHPGYEFRDEHDPSGIGKFYMGREISHVMGHQGADWLEREERQQEEKPDLMVESLGVKAGDVVADIGAGTGYVTRRLAEKTGRKGIVYAVDIQPEMLELLQERLIQESLFQVVPVMGSITTPHLPPGHLDLVVMVDVYHEFSYPYEMLDAIVRSLKPGGQVAFVEYRAEDPDIPIKRLHKMSEEQVKKEALIHNLEWVKTAGVLPRQHIILFRKPERS